MLKGGDKVKMLDGDRWVYGEVTIANQMDAKVMFEDSDLDYTYYLNRSLTKITEEEFRNATKNKNS